MPNQQPNLEQQFNQPLQTPNLAKKPQFNLKYILIVLILAILVGGGVLAYQYWWLPKHETKPPEITIENETAGLKTYENQDLGFSFKYPKTWKYIGLIRQKNDIIGFPGILYSNYGEVARNYFDPDKVFDFNIFSKDYRPYEVFALNNKKVDVNWSTSEFVSNMGIDPAAILFTKKLSEKSMLVAIYQSPECSPGMSLEVITPLTNEYPNFEIIISDPEFGNDPILKAYEDEQIAKTGVGCDMLGGYQKVAEKILNGEYPKLKQYIETARQIADSLKLSETANWQTYQNEEYGFEVKIPKNYSEFKSENLKSVWIIGPSDLSLFIDKSINVNKELVSLYDYINYIYKTDYYDNPNSGAYHYPKYIDIMSSGEFVNIASEDKNIEIWREKLTGALGGFESIAYLMDRNNKTTMITFSWGVTCQDEKLAEELLTQFNQILSTFKFISR